MKRGRRKVPRKASCASPSLQRGQNFPVAAWDTSEKGAVPGQENGNDRGERRENATDGEAKEIKSSAVLHVLGNGA